MSKYLNVLNSIATDNTFLAASNNIAYFKKNTTLDESSTINTLLKAMGPVEKLKSELTFFNNEFRAKELLLERDSTLTHQALFGEIDHVKEMIYCSKYPYAFEFQKNQTHNYPTMEPYFKKPRNQTDLNINISIDIKIITDDTIDVDNDDS